VTAYTLCRYVAAMMLLLYGFAKITGAQFTIVDSELDKPMGHVSGFWLTWYYFGYSPIYSHAIAVIEIAGGLALTFLPTALVAACALLPIVVNIVLVDLAFGVDLGGLLAALIVTLCLAVVVAHHRTELRALLPRSDTSSRRIGASLVRIAMVLTAALFMYWVAHYNNREPTPLDGRWEVLSGTFHAPEEARPLSHIYFELNRAHMCVLRFGDRWSRAHHFLIDQTTRTIGVWRDWNRQARDEDKLFTGTYELDGNRLVLRGRFIGSPEPSVLVLQRVS
jgi:hypothetical protein